MNQISPETQTFIREHRQDDVRALALQANKYPQVDMAEAVVQIAGWQIAEKKVPLWARTEGILYPRHLSMEQPLCYFWTKHSPCQIHSGIGGIDRTA